MTGKKPEPLKGKISDCPCGYTGCTKIATVKVIRSAVEWLKELEILLEEAVIRAYITRPEWEYWQETLKYEEAFEDVMK